MNFSVYITRQQYWGREGSCKKLRCELVPSFSNTVHWPTVCRVLSALAKLGQSEYAH